MKISVNEILINEEIKQIFKRFDVAMIYSVIDRYVKGEDKPFELYRKLQHLRNSKSFDTKSKWEENLSHGIYCIKKYIKLYSGKVDSVELIRMDRIDTATLEGPPIQISQNLRLLNGSHRLATALYFTHKEVEVEIDGSVIPSSFEFQINWLEKYFTEKEQEDAFKVVEKIRKDYGFKTV